MANAKGLVFEQFAELARVLAHAHRLELIEHVSQGERSVERLAQLTGLSIANASQHLQQLRRGGFVQSRRDGKRILYQLGKGPILSLMSALRVYAESSRAEVREVVSDYFQRLDALEPISREHLLDRLHDGSVTVLDVRPEDQRLLVADLVDGPSDFVANGQVLGLQVQQLHVHGVGHYVREGASGRAVR